MKKKWIRAALALVCVFGALLAAQMLAGAQGPCTLQVYPCDVKNTEDEAMLSDLMGLGEDGAGPRLGFDLYKVAGMVPSQTMDTYDFTPTEDFPDVEIPEDITTAGWQEIARQVAERIFWDGDGKVKEALALEPVLKDKPMGDKLPDLEPGLYLVVAHERGKPHKEYLGTAQDGKLVTQFQGEENRYTFLPELITLPTKEAVDGEINTANPGGWLNDVVVYLKPQVDDAKGPIRVTKKLLSYGHDSPVTFVFRVQAFKNDKMVYEKVVSMDFTQAGSQSITLEDLPVGVLVTVEEIYSGASCKFVERIDPEDPTVHLEFPIEFTFVNDFDNTNKGHGILNRFVFVKGEGDDKGHWVLNPEAGEGGEAP